MAAANDVYQSARLAAGYAFHRPPVHPRIIAKLRERLQITQPLLRALDIGCGAGLSTAALESLAEAVVGIDPMATMLTHHQAVSTQAHFVIAQAEALPFAAHSFDLLTAAGALNYTDLEQFFPEAVRVMTATGVLAIYDFSEGKRLRDDARLEEWYAAFKRRYPSPPGYALPVRELNYERYGLHLTDYEELEVAVPMTHESYVRYALSETSVELALANGASEAEIMAWCNETLAGIFGEAGREVLFDAYIACIKRQN